MDAAASSADVQLFFHIALRNSEFCHTLVDNNLHLTNWRRKHGCHCQHKYAVDWCGCSPNDFRPSDMDRIQRTESRDLFFARKFESSISHEAVTMVDKWVHGPLPGDLAALHRHWVCQYHREDLSPADDAALTFYRSVARLSLQRLRVGGSRCELDFSDVVAAYVHKKDDSFKGTVVQFELSTSEGPVVLEAIVGPLPTPIRRLKKGSPQDRLTSMGISTDFDQKEAMFRNFGRVMGVFATPVIMHRGSANKLPRSFNVARRKAGSDMLAKWDIHLEPERLVLQERRGAVALITLNRPAAKNALCDLLMSQLTCFLDDLEADCEVRVIVITGQTGVFAAGADIKEMLPQQFPGVLQTGFLQDWDRLSRCHKPVIAAVNGYALGGGCELAMMCDVVYASDGSVFGQPEILLGTIPGAGGTQRLCRAVGRSLAMEMCLTGRKLTANEALQAGLVSRVFPAESLLEEALKTAQRITQLSPTAVLLCKRAVNAAHEMSLAAGLRYERDLFYSTFATEDRRAGMEAFVQKKPPSFSGK